MKKTKLRKPGSAGLNRRTFVKLLPAAGAAGLTISSLSLPAAAQTPTPTPSPRPSPTPPLRITKDMMHNAEKLIGIELNDKQEEMALPGVNRNLDNYEAIRKIDVPLDTEPAIAFHPAQPGFHIKRASSKTKFRFGRNDPMQFKSVEDLAFEVEMGVRLPKAGTSAPQANGRSFDFGNGLASASVPSFQDANRIARIKRNA